MKKIVLVVMILFFAGCGPKKYYLNSEQNAVCDEITKIAEEKKDYDTITDLFGQPIDAKTDMSGLQSQGLRMNAYQVRRPDVNQFAQAYGNAHRLYTFVYKGVEANLSFKKKEGTDRYVYSITNSCRPSLHVFFNEKDEKEFKREYNRKLFEQIFK